MTDKALHDANQAAHRVARAVLDERTAWKDYLSAGNRDLSEFAAKHDVWHAAEQKVEELAEDYEKAMRGVVSGAGS